MNVVFDLDDTLYLERDYVRSGFNAVSAHLESRNIRDFAGRAWAAFERGVRGTIFDTTLKELGVDPAPELLSRLVEIYRSHVPGIQLEPDSRTCLDALRDRVTMALITDGPALSQRAKLHALRVSRWIGRVVVTDELGPGGAKPNSKPFRILQGDADPRSCLYVGDNPAKDFTGPIALGWRTVRLRRQGGLHFDVPDDPQFKPGTVLHRLDDLPSLIESWS